MSNASPLTLFLIRYPVIIFSIIMLVAGLVGLVFGRLSIGHIKLKGVLFRILCAILFLGAAGYFIPKYGLAVEIVLAVVLVIIALLTAEKPAAAQPLDAATHTFQSGPGEPPYRLHLRLEKDGSGILILAGFMVLLAQGACSAAAQALVGSNAFAGVIAGAAIAILTQPLVALITVMLYIDLKLRHEGSDLRTAIEAL